ncbi:short-chain dehydrogenase/reductase family 9C member 7-like [Gracilinanus agilis]|uniref:short-chain dehydrogenase/reductase family 9C member 7-like n=1 Tax=Gracilinanus agilis TaxID=191870 RepID=UPI001CFECB30|nr:short-chain dehydrogenase/reductase family 9C member 7-like [Gracilinanus agilis]
MFGILNFFLFLFATSMALGLINGWSYLVWVTPLLGLLPFWRKIAFFGTSDKRIDVAGRAVLITGCDAGFGHSLALRLFNLGFTVFATCLFPDGEGAQHLRQEAGSSRRLHVLKLDVTQDQDVAEAKDFVLKNMPENGLWGLVNNAGIALCGPMEWISFDECKKVIDVNILGSIRTTLKFLPLIKKSQEQYPQVLEGYRSGRLIFMSSINAFIEIGNCFYCLSKTALEKCGDMLRYEVKNFGVKVSLIEPGNYAPATNIMPLYTVEQLWNKLDEENKASYSKKYLQSFVSILNKQLKNGKHDSKEVIDAITDALLNQRPKARYLVATFKEKILTYAFYYLPVFLKDLLYSLLVKIMTY